jgi:CMP-N,N'-diacetyllegionaminic acid synthase
MKKNNDTNTKKEDVKILGIIPARGGSKGIPHKNIEEAKKSKLIDHFIVSTDDKKIAEVAEKYGADVPFLRPKKYSGDNSHDIDFLKHAVSWVEKHRGWKPEIIVFLQPTSPSRTSKDIDNVLKFMIKENADTVRTIVDPGHFNPFKMWTEVDSKKGIFKPMFPKNMNIPRQHLPNYYVSAGLVYATKTKFIKQGKTWWGPKLRCVVIDKERFVDIDEPSDIKHAERVLKEMGKI